MSHGYANPNLSIGIGASGELTSWATATTLQDSGISVATLTSALATVTALSTKSANYFDRVIYNVLDHGITCNGSTDDLAAWNALFASTPDACTFILPPGTSKITGTMAIPSGKHFRFIGAGPEKTFISTSSATLDMITVGDWQSEFSGITFKSSTTRSAGYAINAGSNVSIFITNCNFNGMFNGALLNGTLCYVRECTITNTVNFGLQFNGTAVNSFVQGCTFDSNIATVAQIEVNLCGSLLIDDCDIIHGVNNLRINPSSSGAFSLYCSNVFFDTASGSSVKCQGTSDIQRLKFTNCWLSGSVNGMEFAGATGTNSTTGVDIVNCDIYTNSANGILATTVRDFSVSNCRIANNTTAGINISAAAGAITRFNLQNNKIGPTGIGGPGTGPNGTGVLINAGTYGGYIVTGNDCQSNTTKNINDGGTVASPNQKQIGNNIGQAVGPQNMANAIAITTTPTYIGIPLVLPPNSLSVGSTFRLTLIFSNVATASTTTLLFKMGTNGSTADTTIGTGTYTGTAVADNAEIVLHCTVLTLNAATGTVRTLIRANKLATITGFANVLPPILVGTSTATLNTTTANNLLGVVLSTTVNAVVTLQTMFAEVIVP